MPSRGHHRLKISSHSINGGSRCGPRNEHLNGHLHARCWPVMNEKHQRRSGVCALLILACKQQGGAHTAAHLCQNGPKWLVTIDFLSLPTIIINRLSGAARDACTTRSAGCHGRKTTKTTTNSTSRAKTASTTPSQRFVMLRQLQKKKSLIRHDSVRSASSRAQPANGKKRAQTDNTI